MNLRAKYESKVDLLRDELNTIHMEEASLRMERMLILEELLEYRRLLTLMDRAQS